MVVALHHVVAPTTGWLMRLSAFAFYLVFAVWSVGFGYGFFWKELAGQEFTERQFESAMTELSASVNRTSAMLQTSDRATGEAAMLARERAQIEAREGRTCANHPGSTAGEGPLMRSRFAFADRALKLGNEARTSWFAVMAYQRERLQRQVDALVKRTPPPAAVKRDGPGAGPT
jgi:hypothetical protein